MPPRFERLRKKKGARVRTITKGPNKGRQIVFAGNETAMGERLKKVKKKHASR